MKWIIFYAMVMVLIACGVASANPIHIQTIAYEASGEPIEGQMLVAKVIQNRMKQRNKTADQICLQKYQFSCWKDGKPTQSRKLTTKELQNAHKAWRMASGETFSANIYMRSDCKPKWLQNAISKEKVKYLKTVGSHSFYKE